MLMKAEQSTLLLIDVQEKLMPAISHGDEVVDRCIVLATIAGLMEVPVLGTEQLPDKLGHNVEAVRELCNQTLARLKNPSLEPAVLAAAGPASNWCSRPYCNRPTLVA